MQYQYSFSHSILFFHNFHTFRVCCWSVFMPHHVMPHSLYACNINSPFPLLLYNRSFLFILFPFFPYFFHTFFMFFPYFFIHSFILHFILFSYPFHTFLLLFHTFFILSTYMVLVWLQVTPLHVTPSLSLNMNH